MALKDREYLESIGVQFGDADPGPAAPPAPAPAGAQPDTSFSSAFLKGAGDPLRAIGTTARVFGAEGVGTALESVPKPENYESATDKFINPGADDFSVGGLAPAYIPRAVVEQAGQLFGSIASRVAGAGVGGALGGATAGPAGAAGGAAVGAFAGPFFFGAMQVAGPTALERAKNNGRSQPNTEDIMWALGTAAASGSLDALGARYLPGGETAKSYVGKVLKGFAGEGATEGTQSVVEQAGGTGGTEAGLQIDPKQAIGEGLLGGAAGGAASAVIPGGIERPTPKADPVDKPVDNPATAGDPLDSLYSDAKMAGQANGNPQVTTPGSTAPSPTPSADLPGSPAPAPQPPAQPMQPGSAPAAGGGILDSEDAGVLRASGLSDEDILDLAASPPQFSAMVQQARAQGFAPRPRVEAGTTTAQGAPASAPARPEAPAAAGGLGEPQVPAVPNVPSPSGITVPPVNVGMAGVASAANLNPAPPTAPSVSSVQPNVGTAGVFSPGNVNDPAPPIVVSGRTVAPANMNSPAAPPVPPLPSRLGLSAVSQAMATAGPQPKPPRVPFRRTEPPFAQANPILPLDEWRAVAGAGLPTSPREQDSDNVIRTALRQYGLPEEDVPELRGVLARAAHLHARGVDINDALIRATEEFEGSYVEEPRAEAARPGGEDPGPAQAGGTEPQGSKATDGPAQSADDPGQDGAAAEGRGSGEEAGKRGRGSKQRAAPPEPKAGREPAAPAKRQDAGAATGTRGPEKAAPVAKIGTTDARGYATPTITLSVKKGDPKPGEPGGREYGKGPKLKHTPSTVKDTLRDAKGYYGKRGKPIVAPPKWIDRLQSLADELAKNLDLPPIKVWVFSARTDLNGFYALHNGADQPIDVGISSTLDEKMAASIFLHEIGHAIDYIKMRAAPPKVQAALKADYDAWLARTNAIGRSKLRYRDLRPRALQNEDATMDHFPDAAWEYMTRYEEWLAERIRDWLVTKKEPAGLAEKFFKGLADLWKGFFRLATGYDGSAPAVDAFMNGLWDHAKAKPIPKGKAKPKRGTKVEALKDEEISVRVPKNKKSPVDWMGAVTGIGLDTMRLNPETFAQQMERVKDYPGFTTRMSDPDLIAEDFINHTKENLLWLHDQMSPTLRYRAKQWYDGANLMAKEWAKQFDTKPRNVAAVIAALSPQNDWFRNLSTAERVLDINRHLSEGGEIPPKVRARAKGFAGELASQLDAPYALMSDIQKAFIIRAFDEGTNSKVMRVSNPEGDFADYSSGSNAWTNFYNIARAVSLIDAPLADINRSMGLGSKIRSFYNNIINPNGSRGDVTIDTHAVAAALLMPLSASSTEVAHAQASTPEVAKRDERWAPIKLDREYGNHGLYGLYAEAYRRAAEERGILPREMQSITWEAARGLYSGVFKRKGEQVIAPIWQQVKDGKLTPDQARSQLLREAGGISAPAWAAGSSNRGADAGWTTSYGGKLAQARIRRAAAAAGRDAAGGTDARVAEEPGYIPFDREVRPDADGTDAARELRASKEDFHRDLKAALAKPGWAILSGTREDVGAWDHPANAEANDRLREMVKEWGGVEIDGAYEGVYQGPSFLIFTDEDTASALGQEFGQESVLTNRGLVYADGRRVPARHEGTSVGDGAKDLPFYSTLDDGQTFSMDLDFDAMEEPATALLDYEAEPGPDSEAFRRWFKGSQVNEEWFKGPGAGSGSKPVAVYHSTRAKEWFEAFRSSDEDIGMHFGSRQQAEERALAMKPRSNADWWDEGVHIYKAYLSIKNPIRLEDPGSWNQFTLADQLRDMFPSKEDNLKIAMMETPEEIRNFLISKGYDGVVYRNTGEVQGGIEMQQQLDAIDKKISANRELMTAKISDEEYARLNAENRAYYAEKTAIWAKRRDAAYDLQEDSFIAFFPHQIKSAIGNRGTFDPNEASILADLDPAQMEKKGRRNANVAAQNQGVLPTFATPSDPTSAEMMKAMKRYGFLKAARDGTAWKDFLVSVRRSIQDAQIDLKRVQKAIADARGVKKLQEMWDVYQIGSLLNGKIGARMEDLIERKFRPIMEQIGRLGLTQKAMNDLLVAQHAKERNRSMQAINPNVTTGSGMSDADAEAIIAAATPEMLKLADQIRDIIRDTNKRQWEAGLISIENAVQFGLISKQDAISQGILSPYEASRIPDPWTHYVPLRGFEGEIADGGDGIGQGYSVAGKEFRQAFGRDTVADGPMAYILNDAARAIVRSEKNQVGIALYRLVTSNPNPELWELQKRERQISINPETGMVQVRYAHNNLASRQDNVFTVKIGGKERHIEIFHAGLVTGLKNLSAQDQGLLLQGLNKITRYLSAVNTSFSPEWFVSNVFRDMQTAMVQIGDEQLASIRKEILGNWGAAVKGTMQGMRGNFNSEWAQIYRDFDLNGGRVNFLDYRTVEDFRKNIDDIIRENSNPGIVDRARMTVRAMMHGIETFNGGFENAIRVATYKALLDRGYSKQAAASAAREITVNFNRKGTAQYLNALYMFFNASVQGNIRLLQSLVRSRAAQAAFGGYALWGMVEPMLAEAFDDEDDDWYERIPGYVRERNVILPGWLIGHEDTPYYKIPIPYGLNMAKVFGQELVRAGQGKAEPMEAAASIFTTVLDAANPLGSTNPMFAITPTVLDPLWGLYSNTNELSDRAIRPQNINDKRPDSEQYFKNASSFSIAMSNFLNEVTGGDKFREGAVSLSPNSVDYVIGAVTGGLGRFFTQAFNTGARVTGFSDEPFQWTQTPFIRTAIGLAGDDRAVSGAYYDIRSRVEQAAWEMRQRAKAPGQDLKATREELAKELKMVGLVKSAEKQLDALKKAEEAVTNDLRLDRATRVERLDRIRSRRNQIQSTVTRRWKELQN